jgi:dolichol-phosphate mannosyltransferase
LSKEIEISIVSPVYKAENIIEELISRLERVLNKMNIEYEIILIDDRSPDSSWEKIVNSTKKNSNIKGLRLSKNFGQHSAISAGLDYCKGKWVVVMDCDLQDSPNEIPRFYEEVKKGGDIVWGKRIRRKDKFFKRIFSKAFYKIFFFFTSLKYDSDISNFGIFSRRVINSSKNFREQLRAFPFMIHWLGFNVKQIEVVHSKRFTGKSSYNFIRLVKLGFNISISYSNKPLIVMIGLGLIISSFAFILGLIWLIKFLSGEITVLGYTSLILSVWFLSGLILLFLGLIGLYIDRIFNEVKNRPIYVIDTTSDAGNF